MLNKLSQLPKSLKIVFWTQLPIVVLNAVLMTISVVSDSITAGSYNLVNIVLSILVVVAMIQRSKFTRFLALALISAGILVYGFSTIGVLATGNPGGIWIIVQLTAFIITLWGLRTKQALEYFQI